MAGNNRNHNDNNKSVALVEDWIVVYQWQCEWIPMHRERNGVDEMSLLYYDSGTTGFQDSERVPRCRVSVSRCDDFDALSVHLKQLALVGDRWLGWYKPEKGTRVNSCILRFGCNLQFKLHSRALHS